MPRKAVSPNFELLASSVQPWLVGQSVSPELVASPFRHALVAREKVLEECQRFAEAWCDRHLEANAEVLDHLRKRSKSDGKVVDTAPLNGWAMKAAQTLSEDMNDAMTFWMNCTQHCFSEAQPVVEEVTEEMRVRTADAAQKKK